MTIEEIKRALADLQRRVDILSKGGGGGGVMTNHNLLGTYHPDAVVGSPTSGDIIIANATPKWQKLAKGADDKVLTLKSGLPSWETSPTAAAITASDILSLESYSGG